MDLNSTANILPSHSLTIQLEQSTNKELSWKSKGVKINCNAIKLIIINCKKKEACMVHYILGQKYLSISKYNTLCFYMTTFSKSKYLIQIFGKNVIFAVLHFSVNKCLKPVFFCKQQLLE